VVVGTVTVYDEEERPFQSMIDQGRYYVSGIPEGPIKIIVISEDPNKSNLPPGAPKREGSKPRVKGGKAGEEDSIKPIEGWFKIPNKYADPKKTPLKMTLKPGDNDYDINLVD